MVLYHGSDKIITVPKYNYGNPTNDYGLGFYMTSDYDAAKLWASRNRNTGYVNSYEINLDKLNILYLDTNSTDDVLKWITILIVHRFDNRTKSIYRERIEYLKKHYYVKLDEYDVIIGYRADDSYFQYSKEFLANELSIEKLKEAMVLGKLGKQIVLKSRKSFERIKYINSDIVNYQIDYENFRLKALADYHKIKNSDSDNNTFIRDIIRGD